MIFFSYLNAVSIQVSDELEFHQKTITVEKACIRLNSVLAFIS